MMRFFFYLFPFAYLHVTSELDESKEKHSSILELTRFPFQMFSYVSRGVEQPAPHPWDFTDCVVELASLLAFFKLKPSKLTETNTKARLHSECFLALGKLYIKVSQEHVFPFPWVNSTLTIPTLRAHFQAPNSMTDSLSSVAFTLCESWLVAFGYH